MFINSIFILLFSLTILYSFPCPPECICIPTDMYDVDFTRMSYLMNCTSISLNNDKFIYQAEQWSISNDKINSGNDDDDNDNNNDYIISLDLSNLLTLKKFSNQTIQFTDFSFILQSLSLTNQGEHFILNTNSFNSFLYENLKILNLSSCCKQIPKECSQIFLPLKKLQILDLSGSDMYKTCLNTPDTLSSTLRDLILRNNIYDTKTFSHSSTLFNGVRTISGKLDLQYSHFQMGKQLEGNCLFDLFEYITTLDLSYVKFESISNDINIHLTHLLKCKKQLNKNRNGEQLINLYLRQLNLELLPEWFTNDRFPFLRLLDLSYNNFNSIDLHIFSSLRYVLLAYNPIKFSQIIWNSEINYDLVNLRSTIRNRTFSLSHRLKNLYRLTTNIDYSENEEKIPVYIKNIPLEKDFSSSQFSLNISRTNLYSFQINFNDLRHLDISYNLLSELNLDEQYKLNYLDCSNQYLRKLILNKQLSELNELKCSNNSLKTIENFSLLKNEQLKFIDLSNNHIELLENLFTNLNSRFLRIINLQSNLIKIIPSNIFHSKLISLYKINLSWNRIHTIKKNAFQSPNLQILDLTGNTLKIVEPNAIFTSSLRLFFVFNNTQQLTNRCIQSKSSDNLLYMYLNWFVTNGTLMNNNQIELNKCLKHYINQTKSNRLRIKGRHIFGYYLLYMLIGTSIIAIVYGGIYCYRKNKFLFIPRLPRYRRLDRNNLVDNAAEMDQHRREDDDIVMNIEEPPFNKFNRVHTKV